MALAQEMVAQGLAPGQAHAVTGAVKAGLVATGTLQTDALSLPAALNSFATVAAGTGAILPSKSNAGDSITIYNGGANDLTVYPPSGGFLDGQSADTPTTHVAASTGMYFCFAKNTWTSVQKGVTGSITGTGSAGDLAVWSGASNIVANSALAPATSVFVGSTPFEITESSPSVLQLGNANLTYTAAISSLSAGSVAAQGELVVWPDAATQPGKSPAVLTVDTSGRFGGIDSVLAVNAPESSAASISTVEALAIYNSNVAAGNAWDALLLNADVAANNVGMSYIKGAGIGSPAGFIVVNGLSTTSGVELLGPTAGLIVGDISGSGSAGAFPDPNIIADNAMDLGGITATVGFDDRFRTGYFGTSVAITPVASTGLPGAPIAGEKAIVNDATAPVYGAALVGLGAVTAPVFYNGAAWIVG